MNSIPTTRQETALADLAMLIDKTTALKTKPIALPILFLTDHRLVIELYIKTLFVLKHEKHIIFAGKEDFDERDLYALDRALRRGLDLIDELYVTIDEPIYFPTEITASILTFLKEYEYEQFTLSPEALAAIAA